MIEPSPLGCGLDELRQAVAKPDSSNRGLPNTTAFDLTQTLKIETVFARKTCPNHLARRWSPCANSSGPKRKATDLNRSALTIAILATGFLATNTALACTPKSGALKMSRVVTLDTNGGPTHGTINYGASNLLRKGEVLLTFDDGPLPGRTEPILRALDRHCVKATFFAVGRMAMASSANARTLRETVRRGHTIAGHTWNHANLGRTGLNGGINQIERGFAALEAVTGRPAARLFRFPFLRDTRALVGYLKKQDISSISVDVVSGDTDGYGVQKMLHMTMKRLRARGKGVLLFHDIKKVTTKALPLILNALAREGYKVVHLKTKDQYSARPKLLAHYQAILDRRAAKIAAKRRPKKPPFKVVLPVQKRRVATRLAKRTGSGSFFSYSSASSARLPFHTASEERSGFVPGNPAGLTASSRATVLERTPLPDRKPKAQLAAIESTASVAKEEPAPTAELPVRAQVPGKYKEQKPVDAGQRESQPPDIADKTAPSPHNDEAPENATSLTKGVTEPAAVERENTLAPDPRQRAAAPAEPQTAGSARQNPAPAPDAKNNKDDVAFSVAALDQATGAEGTNAAEIAESVRAFQRDHAGRKKEMPLTSRDVNDDTTEPKPEADKTAAVQVEAEPAAVSARKTSKPVIGLAALPESAANARRLHRDARIKSAKQRRAAIAARKAALKKEKDAAKRIRQKKRVHRGADRRAASTSATRTDTARTKPRPEQKSPVAQLWQNTFPIRR